MVHDVMIVKYAAIIIRDHKILLVRKKGTSVFISPGGKPEFGETQEDCLRREIYEELGTVMLSSKKYRTDYSVSAFEQEPIKIVSYLVEIASDPVPASEIEELKWVSVSDIATISVASIFRDAVIPALSSKRLIQ